MNSTSKPILTYDEYAEIESKLSIRVGQIVHAERIPKSDGLKLTVIFGPDKEDEKTVFTILGRRFDPEKFIGLSCPFVMNLAPREIKGIMSEVMIMVAESEDGVIDLDNYRVGSKLL